MKYRASWKNSDWWQGYNVPAEILIPFACRFPLLRCLTEDELKGSLSCRKHGLLTVVFSTKKIVIIMVIIMKTRDISC